MLTAAKVLAIEPTQFDVAVRLSNREALTADLVVIGVGALPNTDLARSAGLACSDRIEVDARLRTSDPHIFAAGDCCKFPAALYGGKRIRLENWRNAHEQGEYAAQAMLVRSEQFESIPSFWSDQYDLGLQVVGLPDSAERTVERRVGGNAFIVFHLGDDRTLAAASGIGAGSIVARDIKVAEAMIRRRMRPAPTDLADSSVSLKSLLRSQS